MKDRNGNDISIGDRVIVEGTITSISDTVVVVQDDQGDAFSIPGERVEKLVVESEGDPQDPMVNDARRELESSQDAST